MDNNIGKTSEDLYAGVDFDDDSDDLKDAEFLSIVPEEIKLSETKEEKTSQFYGEGNKLVAERIIHKKSGKIIEIKYDPLGNRESVTERDKDKVLRKCTDYYANGTQKLVTDYQRDGSYKSMMYNPDGSWVSYVDKHPDGTADAIYYDADGKGTKLIVKLDANKEVIEKRVES